MKKLILLMLLIVLSSGLFAERQVLLNGDSVGEKRGKINNNFLTQDDVGALVLSVTDTTICTTIGTLYKINGTFTDALNNEFTTATDGRITLTGVDGKFIFIGTSEAEADKACELTYVACVNDVETDLITSVDFPAQDKKQNLSIVGLVDMTTGDYVDICVKSNTAVTEVTPATLRVVIFRVGS